MKFHLALAICALALAGCSTTSGGDGGSTPPASSDGLLGSVVGGGSSSVASTIIAEMDGGLIKGAIGSGLSSSEKVSALEAEYRALEYSPSGQKVTWKGSSGRFGEVVAAQPYRVGSQDCRQYSHTVFAGGPSQTARGTACRNPDGSWTPLT